MATILSQGKFFIGLIRLDPAAPTFSRGETVEIEAPFRIANSYIVRVFREFSFLFGKWKETDWDEELALQNAIGWKRRPELDADVPNWFTDEETNDWTLIDDWGMFDDED